jgi:glycosyltransferase involved in cell wall biosynthesis
MSLQVLTAEDDFRARVVIPLPRRRAFVAKGPRPMIDIAVPVHDAERDLARSVRRLHAHLTEGFPFTVQITIADNASTDRTLAIATQLAAELPEVRVLHLNEKGRGRALAAAWLTSDARVVTYVDLDLSTNLSALLPLVAPVISGRSEISIGSGGRLKALRADVARRLVPGVVTRNWLFDMELWLRAQRAGLRIARVRSK